MEQSANKNEVLQRAGEQWASLWDLIRSLPPGRLERPLGNGWSVKEHIAHVAAWEASTAALLRGQHRGDALGVSRDMWAGHDVDAINRDIVTRAAALDWTTIQRNALATHADLVELVQSMTQDELDRPYSDYAPYDPPYNETPVIAWVSGNTWDHYDEHIGWITNGLGRAD
ncbi:MAG TPA: ClbS/DfsB family four-helix bundle protein [Tepidiformaceae bacterium]|nr:ClbS/DfsB family four-helix bundle protein [Tepidiformaceae bacterium]